MIVTRDDFDVRGDDLATGCKPLKTNIMVEIATCFAVGNCLVLDGSVVGEP